MRRVEVMRRAITNGRVAFTRMVKKPTPIVCRGLKLGPRISCHSSTVKVVGVAPPRSTIVTSSVTMGDKGICLKFTSQFANALVVAKRVSSMVSTVARVISCFESALNCMIYGVAGE